MNVIKSFLSVLFISLSFFSFAVFSSASEVPTLSETTTSVVDDLVTSYDSEIINRLDILLTLLLTAFSLIVTVVVCYILYRFLDNFMTY